VTCIVQRVPHGSSLGPTLFWKYISGFARLLPEINATFCVDIIAFV
jgi:hypothetical protein